MLLFAMALAISTQAVDGPPMPPQPSTYAEVMAAKMPVTTSDITDRPYRVLKHVKGSIRKATIFSKASSPEKLQRELWERGKKEGADAVINARYGDSHITAISWGASKVEGDAVKFLAPGETAPAAPATPN